MATEEMMKQVNRAQSRARRARLFYGEDVRWLLGHTGARRAYKKAATRAERRAARAELRATTEAL